MSDTTINTEPKLKLAEAERDLARQVIQVSDCSGAAYSDEKYGLELKCLERLFRRFRCYAIEYNALINKQIYEL